VHEWYRAELKKAVPSLFTKWELRMGAKVKRFFVQKNEDEMGQLQPRL
jgi:hypothetical protein